MVDEHDLAEGAGDHSLAVAAPKSGAASPTLSVPDERDAKIEALHQEVHNQKLNVLEAGELIEHQTDKIEKLQKSYDTLALKCRAHNMGHLVLE